MIFTVAKILDWGDKEVCYSFKKVHFYANRLLGRLDFV